MRYKIEFEGFTAELLDGTTETQRDNYIAYMLELGHVLKNEPSPLGVWFVYGYDTSPFPLYMSDNEDHVNAYMAGEGLPYHPWKVFWPFNQTFSNVIQWAMRSESIRGGDG